VVAIILAAAIVTVALMLRPHRGCPVGQVEGYTGTCITPGSLR